MFRVRVRFLGAQMSVATSMLRVNSAFSTGTLDSSACSSSNSINTMCQVRCASTDAQGGVKEAHTRTRRPEIKFGDWICAACQAHNFAKKTRCHMCGKTERPVAAGDGRWAKVGEKPPTPLPHMIKPPMDLSSQSGNVMTGDWLCRNCNAHNHRDRTVCHQCANPINNLTVRCVKKESGPNRIPPRFYRYGDWICRGCSEHNFGRHSECATVGCRFKIPRIHQRQFSVGANTLRHLEQKAGEGADPMKLRAAAVAMTAKHSEKQEPTGPGFEVFRPGDWICKAVSDRRKGACLQHNIAKHRYCVKCNTKVSTDVPRIAKLALVPKEGGGKEGVSDVNLVTGFVPEIPEDTEVPPLPAQMTDGGSHASNTGRVLSVGRKKRSFWLCNRCATYNAPDKLRCFGCAADRPKYMERATTPLDAADMAERRSLDQEVKEAKSAPAKEGVRVREMTKKIQTVLDVKKELGDGSGDSLHFGETEARDVKAENEKIKKHNRKVAALVDKVQQSREYMMNSWLCSQCHTVSDCAERECSACGFQNPHPTPTVAEKRAAAMEEVRRAARAHWEEKQAARRKAKEAAELKRKESLYKTPSPAAALRTLNGQSWLCMQCETVNLKSAFQCKACTLVKPGWKSEQTLRDEEEQRVTLLRYTVPSRATEFRTIGARSWLCMQCQTVNPQTQTSECRACGLPKPSPPPSSEGESVEKKSTAGDENPQAEGEKADDESKEESTTDTSEKPSEDSDDSKVKE